MLYNYRRASTEQHTNQFVLPETMKILPLLTNAALKLPALSLMKVGVDLRMYSVFVVRSLPVINTCLLFNPRVYRLHDIMSQEHMPGTLSETETTLLPTLVPASREKLEQNGCYLIDNGELFVFLFTGGTDWTFAETLIGTDMHTF
jgi:hypothetical protein